MEPERPIAPSTLSVKDLPWQILWDLDKCTLCGKCTAVCPVNAIELGVFRKRILEPPADITQETATAMERFGAIDLSDPLLFDPVFLRKTETLAVVASGLMVLLPVLAEQIPDERIRKFKTGIHIGVFGPSYNIVSILCGRLQDRLWSKTMKAVMADAEIGLLSKDSKKDEKQTLALKNGSNACARALSEKPVIERSSSSATRRSSRRASATASSGRSRRGGR